MTDNTDEFDQDQFDSAEEPEKASRGVKQSFLEAWRQKPLFKLLMIMAFVGFALAGALGAFSSPPPVETAKLAAASHISEPPGSKASSFFIEQNKQENEHRVGQALEKGGSAMPTPVGTNVDLSDLTDKNRKDPMVEFRAESERLKQEMRAEQKMNAQQLQAMQQQLMQRNSRPAEEDDSLARAMQRQMQELMQGWTPRKMTSVAGIAPPETAVETNVTGGLAQEIQAVNQARAASALRKAMVPAGTVNYAQLLTEANSDVQGPILAQILSGPLAGGRAIGRFQVMNDYLVMTFSLVSYKGKEYTINALALDPNTTLGGMATEVDHRYFSRVLLPAAASFMSAFGSALSSGSSETTVDNGTIVVEQAKKGYKDATYAGLGQMGNTIGQFFQNQANQTKPLVRVAVGTAMGLFFLQPVYNPEDQEAILAEQRTLNKSDQLSMQELLARGYQQGLSAGGYNPAAVTGYGATAGTGYNTLGTSPYGTSPYGTSMTNLPSGVYATSPTTPAVPVNGTTIYYGNTR